MSRHSKRALAMWWTCLASAFRTALACAIVGCVTLYGPPSFQRSVAFPAFSYVTVILIVTNATLGDAWQGCWHATLATAQTIGPAMLALYLIGPTRLSGVTTAVAAALAAFVVAAISRTHQLCKRIALGQIVLVYVIGFIEKEDIDPIMHPVHVAASTAIGALACTLALLLPFPRLATNEVRQQREAFLENASKRLKLYLKAAVADDKTSVVTSMSQGKFFAIQGSKHIQFIKRYQGSVKWETFPFKSILKSSYQASPGNSLEEMFGIHLRGIEMALTGASSFPVYKSPAPDLKTNNNYELDFEKHIKVIMERSESRLFGNDPSSTVSESKLVTFFRSVREIPQSIEDLSSTFFLFCLKLLHRESSGEERHEEPAVENSGKKSGLSLMPAFKCSISLGFASLFGLFYSRENGYWAGLPLAISFSSAREATFRVANVKAQGTVLGTVYGVIGSFLFHRYLPVRFFSLVPWFLFSSLLEKSKMYGKAGGVAVVIGAVLILGRKNFGPPGEFAIARIVETFIGLSCSIAVEVLLGPSRASSMAKLGLKKCFRALNESVVGLVVRKSERAECQRKLRSHVHELGEYVDEAEMEPSFWFLPFNAACYWKLHGSLSKLTVLLHFMIQALRAFEGESAKLEVSSNDLLSKLYGDIGLFRDLLSASMKHFEEILTTEPTVLLGEKLKGGDVSVSADIELGKNTAESTFRVIDDHPGVKNCTEDILGPYLKHSQEVVNAVCESVAGDEKDPLIRSELVLSLSSIGFCMRSFITEIGQMEEVIKELTLWELHEKM